MFELNPDTRLLTDMLLTMRQGEVLTYTEMARKLSRQIDGSDAYLQSARRRAEKEDGFVFVFERKSGLKRLTDAEIVSLGEAGAKGLRRKARKEARRVANVKDYEALSDADKARHQGALALFGAIVSAAKGSTLRRLEAAAAEATGPLPLGRTFDLFKSKA